MVDVQYPFPDADTCLRAIRPWAEMDLFFVEAPLPADDLNGYARLNLEQPLSSPPASGWPRALSFSTWRTGAK